MYNYVTYWRSSLRVLRNVVPCRYCSSFSPNNNGKSLVSSGKTPYQELNVASGAALCAHISLVNIASLRTFCLSSHNSAPSYYPFSSNFFTHSLEFTNCSLLSALVANILLTAHPLVPKYSCVWHLTKGALIITSPLFNYFFATAVLFESPSHLKATLSMASSSM